MNFIPQEQNLLLWNCLSLSKELVASAISLLKVKFSWFKFHWVCIHATRANTMTQCLWKITSYAEVTKTFRWKSGKYPWPHFVISEHNPWWKWQSNNIFMMPKIKNGSNVTFSFDIPESHDKLCHMPMTPDTWLLILIFFYYYFSHRCELNYPIKENIYHNHISFLTVLWGWWCTK